ncbi:MAG: AMP-binding protein [Deltaproteobacteria bacterium]|nr:AMP-binding protein [Deltaproteobacteria bacterium]
MDATEALRRAARRWPEREALRDGDRSVAFAELDARANRLAHELVRAGVGPGDRVATFLPNSIAHVAAQQAILRAGAVWVGINRRLAPPEVAFMLEHAAVRVVLAGADGLGAARQAEGAAVWDVSGADAARERRLAGAPATPPRPPAAEHDVARLRYTSGTTGRPKAAVLTHGCALASLRNLLAELHELSPSDTVAHVAPLTHASEALLAPAFWRGARSILCHDFHPAAFRELVARERVTLIFLVPTMIAALVADPARKEMLASLRTVVYGAAPMPEDLMVRALDVLGPVLLQIYGLSECPFPITTLRKDDHLDPRRRGSCGLPTASNELRVLDATGVPQPPGEVGTIAVRGPQLMREYWCDPEATAAALVDGWLRTGDLGRLDDAGFLTLVDRSDDVIISGGFNVYPREVEVVLEAHPAVAEAAVVGIPHERWGRGVAAWVVRRPRAEVGEHELIDFCRARLAGYKKPLQVTFVETLPKSSTGKLLRRALRTDAATSRSAR